MPQNNCPEESNAAATKAKSRSYSPDSTSCTKQESSGGGLGPVYNATSCASCHQNPVSGSSSQISEIRAGHNEPDPKDPKKQIFVPSPGGSLIHQRAINAEIQEHVLDMEKVRALRMSPTILGDGFVEVIPDEKILEIRDHQPDGLKGYWVPVAVAIERKAASADKEECGIDFEQVNRIGRFGWKCQEASLINFSANAYLNEMGITSPLQPDENKSNGRDVTQFDAVDDPEDDVDENEADNKKHPFGDDVKAFARFMRSLKAPPREFLLLGTKNVEDGEKLFKDETTEKGKKLGCAVCHHPDYTTPAPGTAIKALYPKNKPGSDMETVPCALGNKIIHPYSDFMLHNIGTGDGIAQTQHAQKPPKGAERRERVPMDLLQQRGGIRLETLFLGDNKQVISQESELDQNTQNMIRTAPLWGLRVRPQLLHDGSAYTLDDAILKHTVSSTDGTIVLPTNYQNLPQAQRDQLKAFLNSL